MKRIDVAMTPAEALAFRPAECYVVIDVLRATTTMAVLFERGLTRLTVVDSIERGRALRAEQDVLLFGEEGGLRPPGFDYGNSPAEAAALDLRGRSAVHVTSNGTAALCAVAGRGTVVAGAYVNLSAVAAFAVGKENIAIVCAGNGGATRFSLEDFAVAAAYVQALVQGEPGARLGDGARLAAEFTNPERLIAASEHAEVTRSLGFEADIDLAMRRGWTAAVPVVVEYGPGWCVLEAAPGSSV